MNPWQKLRLMVARGVVNLVNDAGGLQLLQVSPLEGETRDGVERIQNFGASSHPPAGAEPVLVAVAGSRDHLVAVAVDHPASRPRDLLPGESATYNAHGVLFVFDQDGTARLCCKRFVVEASEDVLLDSPHTRCSQALTAEGLLSYQAGLSGEGGRGGTTRIRGDVLHEDGRLSSNGIALDRHQHGQVQRGGDVSGDPQ